MQGKKINNIFLTSVQIAKHLKLELRLLFKRKVYFNLEVSGKQMKICNLDKFQNSYYNFILMVAFFGHKY